MSLIPCIHCDGSGEHRDIDCQWCSGSGSQRCRNCKETAMAFDEDGDALCEDCLAERACSYSEEQHP